MERVKQFLPLLWDGYLVTLRLTLLIIVVMVATGVVLGAARSSEIRWARRLSGAIVEFFRGSSAIVQLFWAVFALPLIVDVPLTRETLAVLVLGINGGSYAAEAVRGGIQAVAIGQWDASIALGFSRIRALRRVILPQALPALLPPFGNFSIEILKGTAIVGFVSVRDLTFWGDQIRASTQEYEVVFSIILVIYFVTALAFSALFRLMENMTPMRRIQRRLGPMDG